MNLTDDPDALLHRNRAWARNKTPRQCLSNSMISIFDPSGKPKPVPTRMLLVTCLRNWCQPFFKPQSSGSYLRHAPSQDISTIPKEVMEQNGVSQNVFSWADVPRPCCIPEVSRLAHVAAPWQEAWAVLPPQPPDTGPPQLHGSCCHGSLQVTELPQNYKSQPEGNFRFSSSLL